MAVTIRGVRARSATTAVSMETSTNAMRSANATPGDRPLVSTRATTTNGPNSPATPAASTNGPSGRFSSPASRRIGISVPIAVVASAMPTSSAESTKSICWRTKAIVRPSASEISQPSPPSFAGRPRTRSKSTSSPPRKKRKARPTVLRNSTTPTGSAKPNTCGPMRMPSVISATTAGRRRRLGRSTSSGASAAAARMTTSDWRSAVTGSRQADYSTTSTSAPAWRLTSAATSAPTSFARKP